MAISSGMNDQPSKETLRTEKRTLPFFVEFVKFATGFAVIIAIALVALRASGAAM